MTLIDIDALQNWVGRRQIVAETLCPAPAVGLAATLDHARQPKCGDALPPLWHWLYFTQRERHSNLGEDGHPRPGGFMPLTPLPRRMWAGGRLTFHDALMIGDAVERASEIIRVDAKQGRQGALVLVTIRHRLTSERGLAIDEEQDVVYRAASDTAAPSENPDKAPDASIDPAPSLWRDPILPDTTLLFRYSALTFNAHRIHYDLSYAREQEGYRDLVVQGPLTATLLVDRLLSRAPGRLQRFEFRGVSPLFAGSPISLCGQAGSEPQTYKLWAEGVDRRPAMVASATFHATI